MSKLARGRLCVIHNNIAEASSRLDVQEQRLVAYLTSRIYSTDKDFQVYSVAVAELAVIFGIHSSNLYAELKKTTKNLVKKVMSLKRLDGPGELQVAWLSSAEYKDGEGIVDLEFSPKLKPYLLQLKSHFTKFPLQEVIRFKSKFSMPIFLLLQQYEKIGWREIAIEELREKLMLGTLFTQYGHLKNKVINVAKMEINEKTSLQVDFSEVREGRKVVAVRFSILAVNTVDVTPEASVETDEEEKTPISEEVFAISAVLPMEEAAGAVARFGAEYCMANLAYSAEKQPHNRKAYLRKALEKNYAKYQAHEQTAVVWTQTASVGEKPEISLAEQLRRRQARQADPVDEDREIWQGPVVDILREQLREVVGKK